MATVTHAPSITITCFSQYNTRGSHNGHVHTQTCANAGFRDSKQYLPAAWVMTDTIVMVTRMKQYWKTPSQMI